MSLKKKVTLNDVRVRMDGCLRVTESIEVYEGEDLLTTSSKVREIAPGDSVSREVALIKDLAKGVHTAARKKAYLKAHPPG